jgi:hypothetical protein
VAEADATFSSSLHVFLKDLEGRGPYSAKRKTRVYNRVQEKKTKKRCSLKYELQPTLDP